jgi:RNA polymerase sigma factor (sigma-70 family)
MVRHLRRMLGPPGDAEVTDGQMLERFASRRDEEAFAELVRRHGPLVLGVCRRVLGDWHDAEDAFQATFLVLARKAGSVARPELLGNWLHGVALRVAAKARAASVRRRERERQVSDMPAVAPVESTTAGGELRSVLDEEVGRLPEKYRAPVVLCYLEGKTNDEAARLLGWPKGTVSGRLARARDLLRPRLARRGLAVVSAAVAVALAEGAAPVAVPGNLIDTTVKAAALVAAGKAAANVVSPAVAALTEGVLRAMFLNKLRIAGVILVCLALLGTGVGVLAFQRPGAPPPGGDQAAPADKKEDPPAPPGKEDDEVEKLLQARVEAADTEATRRYQEFQAGRGTLHLLLSSSVKRLEAELERTDKKDEQLAALKKHVELMRDVEKENQKRFDEGRVSPADLASSQHARIDAELRLARAKAKEK